VIELQSFGFKFGLPPGIPNPVSLVDCRPFKNPHFITQLKPLTGEHPAVQQFCRNDPMFKRRLQQAVEELGDDTRLAAGCFGGKHRSVAFVELLAKRLSAAGHTVVVNHRELVVGKTLYPPGFSSKI
jgi:UPF0042 nucleotide-binding protein